jgi:ribosome biogenesis SPOUT family RNA methylase Rps3
MAGSGKTFVVEHLDPELEEWSSLEYSTIASESHASGAQFLLSSVPTSLKLPANLQGAKGLNVETRGIEEIYAEKKDRVCLLDPAAPSTSSYSAVYLVSMPCYVLAVGKPASNLLT